MYYHYNEYGVVNLIFVCLYFFWSAFSGSADFWSACKTFLSLGQMSYFNFRNGLLIDN